MSELSKEFALRSPLRLWCDKVEDNSDGA